MLKNNIKIIGHRGVAGEVFENTVESVKYAIEKKFDFIEIDVWKTIDNKLIVFHDFDLSRLTHSNGIVFNKTYEEIFEITLKNGSKIPLLSDIISIIKETKIPLIVEVKSENAIFDTVKLLQSNLKEEQYIIGSFFHSKIREIKKMYPKILTAIMLECKLFEFDNYLKVTNPDFVVLSIECIDEDLANIIIKNGKKIIFYTINNKGEFEYVKNYNPYAIVTNYHDFLNR